MAGKGGFNLSHELNKSELKRKFNPKSFFEMAINQFGVQELRDWYKKIGIDTYAGTSNRIFPVKGISPANVLKAIKTRLKSQNVHIHLQSEFVGFNAEQQPILMQGGEKIVPLAKHYIFALGGGSWKVTGANNLWLKHFGAIGIKTTEFQSANCGLNIEWPTNIKQFHIGKPLKNISISHQNHWQKGEALISDYGLEGNAIYPISSRVRETLNHKSGAQISLDFKPGMLLEQVEDKIKNSQPSNYGKVLQLDAASWSLMKTYTTKAQFLNPHAFAQKVKSLPITITSLRPVEEAISTVGGIAIENLNPDFSLKSFPNIHCIGEMVDWDAPTGGFLLHGCFAMGHQLAHQLLQSE